ncbi:hypothetical protein ACHAXN_012661, partial [Cyclotella atomus]
MNWYNEEVMQCHPSEIQSTCHCKPPRSTSQSLCMQCYPSEVPQSLRMQSSHRENFAWSSLLSTSSTFWLQ